MNINMQEDYERAMTTYDDLDNEKLIAEYNLQFEDDIYDPEYEGALTDSLRDYLLSRLCLKFAEDKQDAREKLAVDIAVGK